MILYIDIAAFTVALRTTAYAILKSMKSSRIPVIAAVAAALLIGLLTYIFLQKTKTSDDNISATVTNVIDRPNLAEDGYYGITVQDNDGHRYIINATGYINTPMSPDSRGEACVDVPKVKVGDRVSFNLPKDETQADTYDICYKKTLSGYYFKVE